MRLKLKELREKNGWNQEQVAARAGMSKSYYNEIETGKKAANSRRLQKFSEVFDVPVFELIEDSSLDTELLDHLHTMLDLTDDDRRHVIRHALALAQKQEPNG